MNLNLKMMFLLAAAVLSSSVVSGQSEARMRARQMSGWDARSREGGCHIRVWVDNRAEVRLRGDTIFVRTLEGSRGRDDGSECSQPMPFNAVRDFQIRQTAGRNPVVMTQAPNRQNNFTATLSINDPQGGGDNYVVEVNWRADTDVSSTAPAPFFDETRACQDAVRQRFLSQNARGAYIDFSEFPDRHSQDQNRADSRNRGGNRDQDSIQGRGSARQANESRELTYSCMIDTRDSRVMSVTYQYDGNSLRPNDRQVDRRPLR